MARTIIQFIVLFLLLTLAQVILNKVVIMDVAVPIVFIYLIIRLPLNLSTNWVLTISFLLGLIIDVFGNTQGMNALSCTVLAVMRRPIMRAYLTREEDMSNPVPGIDSLGLGIYIKYMSTLVFIYCMLVFNIEAFTLHNYLFTIAQILASSALSIVLLLGIDSLVSTHREKRLQS